MNTNEYIVPCHFGLEAVLKREIVRLGYEISNVDDGRITFKGDYMACANANISLRTAERVLLKAGEFTASTYDELYENTRAIPWEDMLPKDAKFWVTKASSSILRIRMAISLSAISIPASISPPKAAPPALCP